MSTNLTEVVYNQLFPGGMIPLRCKDNIPAIDARIQEIEELATGKVLEGMNRRHGKAESRILTEQIIQHRESCSPPMRYREIMNKLGNVITPDAARNRYDDYKHAKEAATMQKEGCDALLGAVYPTPAIELEKIVEKSDERLHEIARVTAPPALQEAELQQSGNQTIQQNQIVEKVEEAQPAGPKLSISIPTGKTPKIPHSEDEFILAERDSGKTFREVHEALQAKRISCHLDDVTARYHNAKKKHGEKTARPEKLTQNVVERPKAPKNKAPVQPEPAKLGPAPKPKPQPQPQLDYMEIADSKIINMKKRGMLDHEVAQVLERNPGGRWDSAKVNARYTELQRQGLA
jgi:hypothetical protein